MALLEDVCLFGKREMEALVRFPSLALVVHEEIGSGMKGRKIFEKKNYNNNALFGTDRIKK